MQQDNVVSLQSLIPQPENLKLLILHTPFYLKIQSLPHCKNLVKLDLSKNNLQSFPYLGELLCLRFMFLHQNKLDVQNLIGIFDNGTGQRSQLSKRIMWVTYWKNKNQFQGRHYLVNKTSVIAVDKNMVAPEEKKQALYNFSIQPFHYLTQISYILSNKKKFRKTTTEDEYMKQFWDDLSQLRRKQLIINPVLRLQKVFRGWYYRKNESIRKFQQKQKQQIILDVFSAWKIYIKNQIKLKNILKKKQKQYLLAPLKEMYKLKAISKMISIAKETKKKVFSRKLSVSSQLRFYGVLKAHFFTMKSLYDALCLQKSENLLIHFQSEIAFQENVVPFWKKLNPGKNVTISENDSVLLRYLYEHQSKSKEIIRLRTVNYKTIAFYRPQKSKKSKKQISDKSILKCKAALKKIYSGQNVHLSKKQMLKMQELKKMFSRYQKLNYNQLRKITVESHQMRKDIIRGIYFYNVGFLTGQVPYFKINVLSQYFIKKITSILKIQRCWRGYVTRKHLKQQISQQMTQRRAAVKIQRWIRNLKFNHRKNFISENIRTIKSFTSSSFYIKVKDYLKFLESEQISYMKFLQQNIVPYLSHQTQNLTIFWDRQLKRQQIQGNYQRRKKLFNSTFMKKIFDNKYQIQYSENQDNFEEVPIQYLFHFQTMSSIFNKRGQKYLQIQCSSKYECRFRVLALKILSYRFMKNRNYLSFYNKQSFQDHELKLKKPIFNEKSIFIRRKSSMFQVSAQNKSETEEYQVKTKFYLNQEHNRKPNKFEESLCISLITNSQIKQKNIEFETNEKEKKRIRSNFSLDELKIENYFLQETKQIKLNEKKRQEILHSKEIKSHVKRESFKKFKLQKKLKVKKHNFMLDNVKINEKLTTQPDLTNERSLDIYDGKLQTSQNKRKVISISHQKQKIQNKHQLEEFTTNFINQNNFIQNQHLIAQKRRIKTDFQNKAMDLVDKMKSFKELTHQKSQKIADQRLSKVRLQHKNHKQMIIKNRKERKDRSIEQKIFRTQQKKNGSQKKQFKKIKISFAEECYPIIGKKRRSESIN